MRKIICAVCVFEERGGQVFVKLVVHIRVIKRKGKNVQAARWL